MILSYKKLVIHFKNKSMGIDAERVFEHQLFEERAGFIREHYPGDEERVVEVINSALDGFEVLEKRKDGDLLALLTYCFAENSFKTKYCQFGMHVVDEGERGEGHAYELFEILKEKARGSGCQYITAMADTESGNDFLRRQGFDIEEDPVTGSEYYHLDL